MHHARLVAFNEVRFVSIAVEKMCQLFVVEAAKDCRIRDLVAVQMENWNHRSVARWIQQLVRMPARREWPSLGLAVADHATGQQGRVGKDCPMRMHQGIAQLPTLMHRSR